uniref:ATP synthase subunit d, mitochondrial n=1 Tax=Esox lucius TaxID=8010 RepID=A0A3P8ZZB9_ESOLU
MYFSNTVNLVITDCFKGNRSASPVVDVALISCLCAYRLTSLPEKPVTIDWNFYKANVALPGMVAEFESKFSTLTIPEPKDTATADINVQEAEANKSAVAYIQASKDRIAAYEIELEKFRNMVPFEQMTIEDLNQVFPETKLDKEKYPYWPHKPIADL